MEGTEVIHLRGRTTPIFRLSVLFNIPSSYQESDKFSWSSSMPDCGKLDWWWMNCWDKKK